MVASDLLVFVVNGFNDLIDSTQYAALTNNQKSYLKDSRRNNAKVLSLIEVAMTEIIVPKVEVANYLKEAWDILEINFKGRDKVHLVKLQLIQREFENLQVTVNGILQTLARESLLW